MSLLTPPPSAPQRGDRSTFASRVDAFITWLIGFVSELNIFSANLNSIAAGGAYAIPFVFSGNAAVGGGTGRLSLWDNGDAVTANRIAIDSLDARGIQVKALFDALFYTGNNSATKGFIKITKQSDASKWAVFRVDSWTYYANSGLPYGQLSGACVGYSDVSPFTAGDALIMQCQRTGDKGDIGTTTAYPIMIVRDQTGSGLAAQLMTSGAWNQRRLNTVSFNQISGASVASNQIILPAGSYWIDARAAGFASAGHNLRLYNVTDGLAYDYGISEYSVPTSGTATSTTAELRTYISLTAPKTFRLDHYVVGPGSGNGTGGTPVSNGAAEVYAEIKITKVA